jgi:hypothetical protein
MASTSSLAIGRRLESMANFAKRDTVEPKEPAMATMNISLPDQMKEWVDTQVANGRYANASDAIQHGA